MPKNSTLANEATAEVTGLYLNKYQEIVKPNQRFLVSNYFIHYWLRKLGPTLAWIIVSLQQACWRADNDTCITSQTVIGDEIGLTDRTVRKVLKENPFRHWFIPEIQYQPGIFDYKKKIYQPLPNKYTVYLASPLTPEHLAGLYGYLRTVCPPGQPDGVAQAITDLLNRKSKECLILLEEYAQQTVHTFDRPLPLIEVVTMATGLKLETLPQATVETLNHNLDKLQAHLTELGHTICRQYFRLAWVPRLGPALAWLVMIMRSRCYYNPATEELRDSYTWQKKELAELLGQSTKNLSNLLSQPYTNLFCQILDQNKRKIMVMVNMVYEPLLPEEAGCGAMDNQPLNFVGDASHILAENRKKVPVTAAPNRKKVPVTTPPNRKNVPVTDLESEKSSGHYPPNRKKVPPYKYFKESVPIVDNGHEAEVIQNNDVVVDKSPIPVSPVKDKIKKLLLTAGLSGTGLSKLCNKNPSLDPHHVQAVILYAEANNLGSGYIYRHLEGNDNAIDELFMQFAALDGETLDLFREAVNELKIKGMLSAEIETPVPAANIDLFAKFAEIFAGIEAARVSAILCRRPPLLSPPQAGGQKGGPALDDREREPSLDMFWQQALRQLQLQMAQGTFDTWVKDTRLIARNGLRFTIAAKSGFAKEWLENRLFRIIQRTIANLVISETKRNPALQPPKGEGSNGQELPDVEIDFVVDH